jgi:hypothetical protein
MKIHQVGWMRWLPVILALFGLGTRLGCGAEPTAFELIKDGNRFVGEQSKDRVLEVYSDKSVGGIVPNIWRVAYYDPDAPSKWAEVRFGAGRQMGVKRSWHPFGPTGSMDRLMDLKKLKADSDKVIKTATADPLIAKLTLKATQLWLENSGLTPTWKVRIWAAKLSKPDTAAHIGDIFISAQTGEVVKSTINLKKVE